jgi:hypothetical protein
VSLAADSDKPEQREVAFVLTGVRERSRRSDTIRDGSVRRPIREKPTERKDSPPKLRHERDQLTRVDGARADGEDAVDGAQARQDVLVIAVSVGDDDRGTPTGGVVWDRADSMKVASQGVESLRASGLREDRALERVSSPLHVGTVEEGALEHLRTRFAAQVTVEKRSAHRLAVVRASFPGRRHVRVAHQRGLHGGAGCFSQTIQRHHNPFRSTWRTHSESLLMIPGTGDQLDREVLGGACSSALPKGCDGRHGGRGRSRQIL